MFRRAFSLFSLAAVAAVMALACSPLVGGYDAVASGNRQIIADTVPVNAAPAVAAPVSVEIKVFGVLAVVAAFFVVALLVQDHRAMRRLRAEAASPDLFRFPTPFARSPPD